MEKAEVLGYSASVFSVRNNVWFGLKEFTISVLFFIYQNYSAFAFLRQRIEFYSVIHYNEYTKM